MKYFTKQMWKGLGNKRKYLEYQKRWELAIEDYNEQFTKLQHRLSQSTYDFLKNNSFHDSRLMQLKLIDISNVNKSVDIQQPLNITLEILSGYTEDTYIIEYNNVVALNVKYSCKKQLFEQSINNLGTIGYNELTIKDNDYLEHEFLFSTGSTIDIIW